jgi:transposase
MGPPGDTSRAGLTRFGTLKILCVKWRRQLRAGLFDGVAHSTAVLLPVALPDAPTDEKTAPTSLALQPVEPHRESVQTASGIEIELNGARVRVTGMVDPVQLRLVLRCLMPA